MYWVTSYHLKGNREAEYREWLLSEEAEKLHSEVREETGMRFVDVYWSILGGEYTCEQWWEVPDWGVLGKIQDSKAFGELLTRYAELNLVDKSCGRQNRVLVDTATVSNVPLTPDPLNPS